MKYLTIFYRSQNTTYVLTSPRLVLLTNSFTLPQFGNAHSTHPSLLPGQYSESYEEALRPLKLKLKVTRYDHDHHTAKPGRPVIYFEGTSDRGSPNEAYLRGSVSMTVDGEIQWHFVSIALSNQVEGSRYIDIVWNSLSLD
jgi:hypothetical protein